MLEMPRAESRMQFWIRRLPLLRVTISLMEPQVKSISKKKGGRYLSSVAYAQGNERLFENETLQYCQNSSKI